MKYRMIVIVLAWLLPGVPGQGHAQEYAVTRWTFSYYSDRLDIDVIATSAGQLQVLRGELGRVEVAAHAADGVAGFGLATEAGALRLTALGATRAEYIVVVPEGARIRVRLPGRSWQTGEQSATSRYSWEAQTEVREPVFSMPAPNFDGRLFIVRAQDIAPERIRLLNSRNIRSVEVRVDGMDFRLASSRIFSGQPGSSSLLDIDPGADTLDMVIQIPTGTRLFDLTLGSSTLVSVKDGETADVCGQGIKIKAPNGTWRVVYYPSTGITCGKR